MSVETIALDENWDIAFNSDGCIDTVSECDLIIQKIKQKINLIDFEPLFKQTPNTTFIASLIKTAILDVEGVLSLISFTTNIDNIGCGTVKGLRFNFSALTSCGTIRAQI